MNKYTQRIKKYVCIIRDMNAKVGTNNDRKENIMGKHCIGVINDNEMRLVEFF